MEYQICHRLKREYVNQKIKLKKLARIKHRMYRDGKYEKEIICG